MAVKRAKSPCREIEKMERKEEYLFLREEIMKNNSAAESYRNVMYTVTIALVTIAFSQKEPLLFLLPLCIILPAYKIIIDKLLGMCRIAAYLIVFLEGKAFQWETNLYHYDKLFSKGKASIDAYLYYGITACCSLLAMIRIDFSKMLDAANLFRMAVIVITTILCFVIIRKLDIRYLQAKEKYIDGWKKVKEAKASGQNGSF